MTQVSVTCEKCGRRHTLARTLADPGTVWIVCHSCEAPLIAEVTADHLPVHQTPLAPPAIPTSFRGVVG